MTSPNSSRSPIVEFLGEDAGAGGPFAILGLLHEITSDEQILRASNRRLHQIDRHRHRSTPDAGEVRLAVHAAASQLLDPNLRTELALRWPPGIPVSVPKAWKSKQTSSRLSPGFLHNAKMLIAASGGWNATARKRLAHFARVNRVTALELVGALSPSLSNRSSKPAAAQSLAPTSLSERVYLIDTPPARSLHWIAAYVLLFVMGSVVVSTIVIAPPSIGSQSVASRGSLVTGTDTRNVESESERARVSPTQPVVEREELAHYTAIAHELDQIASRSMADFESSIERFAQIYPLFVADWIAFPEPALIRSGLHISEFVHRVSGAESLIDSLLPIFECDRFEDDPAKLMIQAAVIDVVLSESGLSSHARTELESIRKRCFGNDSRAASNIITALIPVSGLAGVDSRTDDPKWWSQWIKGVRAMTSEDESQRTRLVLSAMSSRLRDPSPADDLWKRTVIELVSQVSWREGAPERYWLLSQFADETVSTSRLAALTDALATHSGAKQINVQMVLNPSSTFLQRQQLAQSYRLAWTTSDPESSDTDQYRELISELHIRVSITPIQMDERQAVDAIVELARLNTAAWQFSSSEDTSAAQTLTSAKSPIVRSNQTEILNLTMNRRDTKWAEQAINSKNANDLSALFAQLVQDNGPGMNSSHALVFLASLHADSEIRSISSAQIMRYKDRPSVLLALDHAIGNKRISNRLEQLIIRVVPISSTSRTDDSWYLHAHAALLELIAQSIAKSVESDLGMLEHELASIYSDRMTENRSSTRSQIDAIAQSRRLYQHMIFDAGSSAYFAHIDSHEIALIESATDVRLARAMSPMHQFLSYQLGICELLANFTEHDIPGSSFPVRDLLAQLDTRLDQSNSVTGQVVQAERCIAQLWIVRLEGARP